MFKDKKAAPVGIGNDSTGCRPMEGLLKKINSSGVWKDRYGQLNNAYFMTYKPKNKKPTSEIKETIDLKQTESVRLDSNENLEVSMDNGEIMIYKGDRINDWKAAIQERLQWIAEQQAINDAKGFTDEKRVHISGYLKKKSHNKYQGLQDRFVKLEGNFLKYYKKESDEKELGSANMASAEFVRPFDDTYDCRTFEVQDDDRVFTYECRSNREMLNWIEILNKVRTAAQKVAQEIVQAKITAELPYRIRTYDDSGEDGFLELIQQELLELYPAIKPWVTVFTSNAENKGSPSRRSRNSNSSNEGGENDDDEGDEEDEEEDETVAPAAAAENPNMTVRQHVKCASACVQYMRDFLPEVQKTANRPARYEILALLMAEVNFTIALRMMSFVNPEKYAKWMRQLNGEDVGDDSNNNSGGGGGDDDDSSAGGSDTEPESSRHPLLEYANLGDLHALIDWITRYQTTLKGIICPCPDKDLARTVKHCQIFDELKTVCHLYAYGGSKGSKGGAAAHLYEHCNKVWESVVRNPEEALQKNHKDGSFYTNAPIGIWEAINQHISLAINTSCAILHVMIADRVVTSLNHVVNNIIDYVVSLDSVARPELKEIELEFVSALANDTALHIEEVIGLIDTFMIVEIKEKIDEIFDPMTTNLVNCGHVCLKRLARLVMSDVQGQIDEVFTEEWLEGNQVSVATATVSDYMSDFEEFLVTFWAEKFIETILEELILCYCRTIVFRKASASQPVVVTHNSPPPAETVKKGTWGFSSFFQKTVEAVNTIVTTTESPCGIPIDDEACGRLAQDINTLNAFFSKKAGQEVATEFLEIINEISYLLFVDTQQIAIHAVQKINEYPSAALAIFEMAQAVIKLRGDDIPRGELQGIYIAQVKPTIETAVRQANENEQNGVAEGRLGLMYLELVPREILINSIAATSSSQQHHNAAGGRPKMTLAQRLKNMSNLPGMGGSSRINKAGSNDEDGDEGDDGCDVDRRDSSEHHRAHSFESGGGGPPKQSPKMLGGGKNNSSKKIVINNEGLLDDVTDILNQQQEEDAAYVLQIEEERVKEEALRQMVGKLSYDGNLEKKSPGSGIWQRRYFKLTTRETLNPDKPYLYSLMWYKKEGGAVLKALEADKISSLTVCHSPRPLAYSPYKMSLSLASEVKYELGVVDVVPTEREEGGTTLIVVPGAEFCTFTVMQTDGKEHVLRSVKVDRIIKWINTLALAAQLGYSEKQQSWTRSALDDVKARQREISEQMATMAARKQQQFSSSLTQPSPARSHSNDAGASPKGRKSEDASVDPAVAAMAQIQAAKEAERLAQQQAEEMERRQREAEEAEKQRLIDEEEERIRVEELRQLEANKQLRKAQREAEKEKEAQQKQERERVKARMEEERAASEAAAALEKQRRQKQKEQQMLDEADEEDKQSVNPIHAARIRTTSINNPLTAPKQPTATAPSQATEGEGDEEDDDADLTERPSVTESDSKGKGKRRASKKGKRKPPPPPPPPPQEEEEDEGNVTPDSPGPEAGPPPAPTVTRTAVPAVPPPAIPVAEDDSQRDSNDSNNSNNSFNSSNNSFNSSNNSSPAATRSRKPSSSASIRKLAAARAARNSQAAMETGEDFSERATTVTTPVDNMLRPQPQGVKVDSSPMNPPVSKPPVPTDKGSKLTVDASSATAPSAAASSSPPSAKSRLSDSPAMSSMKGGRKSFAAATNNKNTDSSNSGANGDVVYDESTSSNSNSGRVKPRGVSFAAPAAAEDDGENGGMHSVCFMDIEDKDSVGLLDKKKKAGCPCVIA